MKVVIDTNVIISAALGSKTCSEVILWAISHAQIIEPDIIAIELEHIDARGELEDLAETCQAAVVNILGGNNADRNGQLTDRLRLARGRNHFDFHQLFDTHIEVICRLVSV